MSTLSPVYAKSRHVYIMAQDFHLFSAMPKSVLFEICTLLFLYISLLEIATIFSSKNFTTYLYLNILEDYHYLSGTTNLYPIPLTV